MIENAYIDSKGCNDALDHINNSCDTVTPFTTISDITTIASTRIVRKSLEEAIAILIDKWGGHLYRDNWNNHANLPNIFHQYNALPAQRAMLWFLLAGAICQS